MSADTVTFILPSAGYGKRVGAPPAKELLPDDRGLPLIDWSLKLAASQRARALVISREDKLTLNRYIQDQAQRGKTGGDSGSEIELFNIQGSRDWPESILMAESRWSAVNIVILPDTRFAPLTAVERLTTDLQQGFTYGFGVFNVDDFSTWGVVETKGDLRGCEKPRDTVDELHARKVKAWGFFGFRRESGNELLKQMLVSTLTHEWYNVKSKPSIHKLESFVDLTRG